VGNGGAWIVRWPACRRRWWASAIRFRLDVSRHAVFCLQPYGRPTPALLCWAALGTVIVVSTIVIGEFLQREDRQT
jgi:hypothetical protein